jgi:hypothetical protein
VDQEAAPESGKAPARRIRGPAWVAIAAIAAGVLFRLYIAMQPAQALAHRYLADDYFYFLSVAHHLANGQGSTFDGGVSFTNGYQPLFAWLLGGLFLLGLDKTAVLHGGLILLTAANAAAAWAAFRLLDADGRPWGGALAAGVLSLGLSHVLPDLTGFETPLALAAVLWTLVLARRRERPEKVGAACGVAFLARVDTLVLAGVLGVRLALRGEWAALRRAALVFALVAIPWMAWSLARFGTIVPDSAAIKAGARGGPALAQRARTIAAQAPRALWPEVLVGPRHAPRRLVEMAGGVALLTLAAFGARRFPLAAGYALLLALAYGLATHGSDGSALNRYLVPAWAVVIVLAASTRVMQNVVPVVVLLGLHLYDMRAYVVWDSRTPPVPSFVGMAYSIGPSVLERLVPEDGRVGSFDAGALGYASARVVVNLDGLMNHDVVALHAACEGTRRACLLDYLHARRISLLAGGSAFGWTQLLPDWTAWERLYESPPLRDGDRLVVVRIPP